MAGEFARYLRSLGDDTDFKFDAAAYRRDGFGPNAAFAGLVAELDSGLAGYLLYHFGYDVDRAARVMHVVDLWVAPKARRCGVGSALMQAASRRCQDAGGVELVWSVYAANAPARRFYEHLGGKLFKDLDFMHLSVRHRRR